MFNTTPKALLKAALLVCAAASTTHCGTSPAGGGMAQPVADSVGDGVSADAPTQDVVKDASAAVDGGAPGGCKRDSDCPDAGALCLGGACQAPISCSTNGPCAAVAAVCAPSGTCVECVTKADCQGGAACMGHVCVAAGSACTTHADCADVGLICSPAGACVPCTAESHCKVEQYCADEACWPDECAPGAVECTTDGSSVQTCSSAGKWAVQACPQGSVCQSNKCIVPEPCGGLCKASEKCVDEKCVVPEPCDGLCKVGEKCIDEKCVPVDPCNGKCTAGQVCAEGVCVEPAKACQPACFPGQVCDLSAAGGKGKCVTPTCSLPSSWGPHIQKVTSFMIADADKGCDLDDDGKPDNAMGALKDLSGSQFSDAVKKGTLVMLFETATYKTDGTTFSAQVLWGAVDPSNTGCDVTKAGCKYTVNPSSYDLLTPGMGPCKSKSMLTNAKVNNSTLKAKGQGMALVMPLTAGIELAMNISQAAFSAQVSNASQWLTTSSGKLCGVISKASLVDAVNAIPDETLQSLGGKATVLSLLESLLAPDIDTDGDDVEDAISVALELEAFGGSITGLTP